MRRLVAVTFAWLGVPEEGACQCSEHVLVLLPEMQYCPMQMMYLRELPKLSDSGVRWWSCVAC